MVISGTYTDQYQLTMAQAYFLQGREREVAVFDYYFRKAPYNGSFAVFSGLEPVLEMLENFKFTDSDIEFLITNKYDSRFIEYLKKFRFRGSVFSSQEGDIVFPVRPILFVEANIIEAQLVETLLLNMLNFQTLISTKARRMRYAAGERKLSEFGMRRAHGTAAYYASRAAIIGGFNSTSNVVAGKDFDIPVSGTMAHSFIQSYDDELSAFRDFAEVWPENSTLLVDTYDTLRSGIPNAIKVAKEMENRGQNLQAVRIDSGDLAYLAKESRKLLDEAGCEYVKIVVSNQLDEYLIKSLLEQHAPIDIFGVGTSLVTGEPDAALDGVYKLVFANGKPRIKISENTAKITIPHKKQVYRLYDQQNKPIGADIISLWDEKDLSGMHHPFNPLKTIEFKNTTAEPLLQEYMKKGKRVKPTKSIKEIVAFSTRRFEELASEYKRFDNPHIYKVGLSEGLNEERNKLIKNVQIGL